MKLRSLRSVILLLVLTAAIRQVNAQTTSPTTVPTTNPDLPTLFIAGDSTVKNHKPYVGWGEVVQDYFDLSKINVVNDAVPGRSSRTYISEGLWEKLRAKLRKGDFVLIQFGHNDSYQKLSIDRYTLSGLGDETQDTVDSKTGEKIQIHTFGFYMGKMISEAQAAGATPIVLSPVPRCKWSDGKIVRGEENHAAWDARIAKVAHISYIDINAIIADVYDPIGQPTIKAMYFPKDNTHTNIAGAKLNAACVVKGLLVATDCSLKDFLTSDAQQKSEATIATAGKAPAKN
jgi:lysophospholipase L1-like esterase